MRIITVNLEKGQIAKIKPLVGNEGLYPSRSELVRVAVRDFLINELQYQNTVLSTEEITSLSTISRSTLKEIAPELEKKIYNKIDNGLLNQKLK